jgi:hypothetical protein
MTSRGRWESAGGKCSRSVTDSTLDPRFCRGKNSEKRQVVSWVWVGDYPYQEPGISATVWAGERSRNVRTAPEAIPPGDRTPDLSGYYSGVQALVSVASQLRDQPAS